MRVRVRLFARLRDIAGAPEVERDVAEGSTLRTVWLALVTEFPDLERYSSSISGALNDEYARLDARVKDGDEVAFLPPVSGG
jgi:molybdopterin converting factor subunit 1